MDGGRRLAKLELKKKMASMIPRACVDASNGNVDGLRNLTIVQLNQRDYRGRSAVHYACAHGQIESLKYLHEAGCDIAQQDNSGLYPLHYCIGASTL